MKVSKEKNKIYENCIKCGCEKNKSTHPWCRTCTRENNSKKTHCRCGNLKENLSHIIVVPVIVYITEIKKKEDLLRSQKNYVEKIEDLLSLLR